MKMMTGFLAAAMIVGLTAGSASAQSLTTGFAGGNSQNGNIFDVRTGNSDLTLNSVALNLAGSAGSTANLAFYYRLGTSVGNQNSSAGWNLFSTNDNVVSAGGGLGTFVDIADLTLAANSVYGLYFTRTDGANVNYTNGSSVGAIAASNADLTIYEGYGKQYAFGSSFSPRVVNATLNYTVDPVAGAVPEIGTWAMMILGMGAVGMALRRRQQVTTGLAFG